MWIPPWMWYMYIFCVCVSCVIEYEGTNPLKRIWGSQWVGCRPLSPYNPMSKHALLAIYRLQNPWFSSGVALISQGGVSWVLTEKVLTQWDYESRACVWKCGEGMKTWKFTLFQNGRQRSGSSYGVISWKWAEGWVGWWVRVLSGGVKLSVNHVEIGQIIIALYFIYFVCLCECLKICNCAMYTQFLWRPKESVGSLGTPVPWGCELPGGCWELVHGAIFPASHHCSTLDQ